MSHRLDPLLQPRSIAMIGASNNPGRIGGMPLDLLDDIKARGRLYFQSEAFENSLPASLPNDQMITEA